MMRLLSFAILLSGSACAVTHEITYPQPEAGKPLLMTFAELHPQRTSPDGNFSDTVLLKSGQTLTNVKATVTREAVMVTDSSGNTRTIPKDQVAGVKTGLLTSPNAGFADTVMLKSGETLTNVKATVTRDSVIVTDSSGKTRVVPKEQVAGVKTSGF